MAVWPGWAKATLRALGAPVTAKNVAFLNDWAAHEGQSLTHFNPLNTTQDMPGAGVLAGNTSGVKIYRNAQQGLQATVTTLTNGHYPTIVEALKSGNPYAYGAKLAPEMRVWGTVSFADSLGKGGGSPAIPPPNGRVKPFSAPSASSTPPSFHLASPPPTDIVPILTDSIGKIGQGWEPTDTLAQATPQILQDWLQPSRLVRTPGAPSQPVSAPRDLRGHPVVQAQQIAPGGGWDGSYKPAMGLARVGENYGLQITSTKRDTKMSASGLVSDHWVGSKNAYAVDLGGSTSQMDRAAIAIAHRLGINYNGRSELVATKTIGGLRYQILYRTHVGGNHFNHIHVGVRRVG